MIIFDEKQLKYLFNKYKIRYKIFEETNVLLIDSGLDEWLIKYHHGRDRPYCLMHKNKLKQTKRYHVQGWKTKFEHLLDSLLSHKNIYIDHSKSKSTYKKNNKINNNKRRKANH